MTQAKFIPWKSRLSKIIKQPGGTTVRGALKDAKRNLEQIRRDCVAEIDAKLGLIQKALAQTQSRPDDIELDALYRLSNDVVGMAGVFDMAELSEAAFSLCELLDRLKGSDQWDGPAVEVHLSALTLLRRATPGAPENQSVLKGLRKLTARVDARKDLKKA